MDFARTTWILIITAVFVSGDECPYVNPQARSMTCIKDLPSVKYRPVDDNKQQRSETEMPTGRRRKKRRFYNETEATMTSYVDNPPPSTPDMTSEFIHYFCSKYGVEMVQCSKDLFDKCSNHPSMINSLFNPDQALKAQSICSRYETTDFTRIVDCVNKAMSSDRVASCVFRAYSRNMKTERYITSPTTQCRATAETYNCFVQLIGTQCGSENVGFIVAVIRSMEHKDCHPIVDTIYEDPVKWASPWTSDSLSMSNSSSGFLSSSVVTLIGLIVYVYI